MSNTDGFTGSVSTMPEQQGESNRRFKGKGEGKKWDKPQEPRKQKGAGKRHNFSWKTRSGNTIQIDDSKGAESITIQHRGGSAFQMLADGSVHMTSHNGKYEIVFGEDRMTVSGLQDVTVKGDATFRVYGDYNVTCHKDYNLTVLGNYNIMATNHNRHILGNIDTQARNENKKLMGSSAKIARGGIAYVSKGSIAMASQSDQGFFGGAAGANLWAKKGNITSNIEEEGSHYVSTKDGSINHVADGQDGSIRMRSKQGKIEAKSKKDMNYSVEEGNYKLKVDQGDIGQEAAQGSIQSNAPSGGIKHEAKNYSGNFSQSAEVTTQQKLDLRASGEASLSGSTTHVSGQTTTHVTGGTSVNVDGPSALNLNGGLGQTMSPISLQIPFNFGQVADAETEKGNSRGSHAPDQPAKNREAVNSWNKHA